MYLHRKSVHTFYYKINNNYFTIYFLQRTKIILYGCYLFVCNLKYLLPTECTDCSKNNKYLHTFYDPNKYFGPQNPFKHLIKSVNR